MSTTVTISIGRNVKGEPMRWERWQAFAARVDAPFVYWRERDEFTVHVAFAESVSNSWDGNAEETRTWVVEVSPRGETLGLVGMLREALARAAREFDQDAIALTIGTTELVG